MKNPSMTSPSAPIQEIYLEPADAPASQEQEGASKPHDRSAGELDLDRLRQLVLEVPGAHKLYPRTPYLIDLVRAPLLTEDTERAQALEHDAEQASSLPAQVKVRLGISASHNVVEVTQEVGLALAAELPGHPIHLEVVSCS